MTTLSCALNNSTTFLTWNSIPSRLNVGRFFEQNSSCSHIHRLPYETLGTIFAYCLPNSKTVLSSLTAPVVLMQVCAHWRAVVFSLPQLWETLNMGEGFSLNPFRIFTLYTQNAKMRAIDLTLSPESWTVKVSPLRLPLFYELVRGSIPRVRSLRGDITLEGIMAIFHPDCSPASVHLPNLKHIDVQRPASLQGTSYRVPTRIDSIHLPNLEFLRLHDLGFFGVGIANSGCAMEKLRTLDITAQLERGMLSHEHVLKILMLSKNIENCRWSVGKEIGNVQCVDTLRIVNSIIHSNFTLMELLLDEHSIDPSFVKKLTAPNLQICLLVND
ncbi:hypothetical protein BU17DRAFT_71604 [Hysterangium stoloniferum]|nr:hypothetical protein BU17DRAFT_71604 [Hysterangium stoloniferum]